MRFKQIIWSVPVAAFYYKTVVCNLLDAADVMQPVKTMQYS